MLGLTKISSMSSLNGQIRAEYKTIWKAVHTLSSDPNPDVAHVAEATIDEIRSRVQSKLKSQPEV